MRPCHFLRCRYSEWRLASLVGYGPCLLASVALAIARADAADVTFNISPIGESDPHSGTTFYADVGREGGYAYVGSDRGDGGMSIFSLAPTSGMPNLSDDVLRRGGGRGRQWKTSKSRTASDISPAMSARPHGR